VHYLQKISLGRLEDEMIKIVHQNIGMDQNSVTAMVIGQIPKNFLRSFSSPNIFFHSFPSAPGYSIRVGRPITVTVHERNLTSIFKVWHLNIKVWHLNILAQHSFCRDQYLIWQTMANWVLIDDNPINLFIPSVFLFQQACSFFIQSIYIHFHDLSLLESLLFWTLAQRPADPLITP